MIALALVLSAQAGEVSVEAGWFAGGYQLAQSLTEPSDGAGPLYPGRLAFGWENAAVPAQGLALRGSAWLTERVGLVSALRAGSYTESFAANGSSALPAPETQELLHAAGTLRLRRELPWGQVTVSPQAGLGIWAGEVLLHGSRGEDQTPATRTLWGTGPLFAGGAGLAWGDHLFGNAEASVGLLGSATPTLLCTELSVGYRIWEGLYATVGWSWSGRMFTITVDDAEVGVVSDQLSSALLGVGYRI